MSDTQEARTRKLAAQNLIPEFESIIRICRGLVNTPPGNPTIPNLVGRVDQIIHKCAAVVHIITMGATPPRRALAGSWRTFTDEWNKTPKRIGIAATVLDHSLNELKQIAEGG